nr:hypothetical protein [Tanacetum cinerariifolium]
FSGRILCIWDSRKFVKDNETISDSFLAICGTWVSSSTKLLIVYVYAPPDFSKKKILWDYIAHMIQSWEGECVILGDFNEVRFEHKRFGTNFNDSGANAFNHFILSAGLIDLPLEEGLLLEFPSLSAFCLDRNLSDHRPIIMRDGFNKIIEDAWNNLSIMETNKISLLKKKLQALKQIYFGQNVDMESNVNCEEIKRAGVIPLLSCLFLKNDAKLVKDFRPISLIGNFYKIIAKILANHLSLVMADLISDVQSAFVLNRQILDGPFILSELIQWCKYHKAKAMVFKVDFEKAFNSQKGQSFVNGSPSSEFSFHKGLKINIIKSTIMGIGTTKEEVNSAAKIIGCSTFSSPFKYLGVKWKVKSLSIRGRFTLIKSVLTSLPLYFMSIYKAPMGVLYKLESICRNFFNGVDNNERKINMIGWKKILAAKGKGGLGVSSFFSYNHALLFKWVWRFRSDQILLWSCLIRAIHGDDIINTCCFSWSSPWIHITCEVHSLYLKGINLLAHVKKKVGNGSTTLFWKDPWFAESPLIKLFL